MCNFIMQRSACPQWTNPKEQTLQGDGGYKLKKMGVGMVWILFGIAMSTIITCNVTFVLAN